LVRRIWAPHTSTHGSGRGNLTRSLRSLLKPLGFSVEGSRGAIAHRSTRSRGTHTTRVVCSPAPRTATGDSRQLGGSIKTSPRWSQRLEHKQLCSRSVSTPSPSRSNPTLPETEKRTTVKAVRFSAPGVGFAYNSRRLPPPRSQAAPRRPPRQHRSADMAPAFSSHTPRKQLRGSPTQKDPRVGGSFCSGGGIRTHDQLVTRYPHVSMGHGLYLHPDSPLPETLGARRFPPHLLCQRCGGTG